ncbi:MAG: HIT family protein [Ignavibacteria bacterium]|nr:HIT family protein [Ignavibacteria bacterium]
MECYCCRSNSGEKRISPGPVIYEGKYWLVEHTYPTALKGWVVIVLKRHAESLHELTNEEFLEFGEICSITSKLINELTGCVKEYCISYSEAEHFNHVHFHIIPRAADLPDELKGSKIFTLLKVSECESVPEQEIIDICKSLKDKFDIYYKSV